MSDLFPISLDEMIVEIEREIALRQRVYPYRIAQRKLSRARADRQIEIMREVARFLLAQRQVKA